MINYKIGDKVKICSFEDLERMYSKKNKIKVEEAKRKINHYCVPYRNGLVVKKGEMAFPNKKYCGFIGEVLEMRSFNFVPYCVVSLSYKEIRNFWDNKKYVNKEITVKNTVSIPYSCIKPYDGQVELEF